MADRCGMGLYYLSRLVCCDDARDGRHAKEIPSLQEHAAEPPRQLVLVELQHGTSPDNSVILSNMIARVHEVALASDAVGLLSERLVQTGYVPDEEADNEPFVCRGITGYRIDASFSRLTANNVSSGVESAVYSIDIDALRAWMIEEDR